MLGNKLEESSMVKKELKRKKVHESETKSKSKWRKLNHPPSFWEHIHQSDSSVTEIWERKRKKWKQKELVIALILKCLAIPTFKKQISKFKIPISVCKKVNFYTISMLL